MTADLLPNEPLRERWIRKIEVTQVSGCPVPGDCWLWRGARDKDSDYGRVQVGGRCKYTHRVFYELLVGRIPEGLQIDHLCRQPACCAPHHLEPVTPKENVRRGLIGSKTHCPSGHPYSGENLYIYANAKGGPRRVCRQCRDAALRKHRAKCKAQRERTWAKYADCVAPQADSERVAS